MDSYLQALIFTAIAISFPFLLLNFTHKRLPLFLIPINWPFVGMLPHLFLNLHRIHDLCHEILQHSNGGTFLFKGPWFSSMEILATINPANVHYIMSKNFANFPKGTKFSEIFEILGDGIFNLDFEPWRHQRRSMHAFLSHPRFNETLVETIRRKVEVGLVPILEHACKEGNVVDLEDLFQRFTFDTICTLVTGDDPGCLLVELLDTPVCKALDDAEEALFLRHAMPESIWKLGRWLNVGKERRLNEAWKTIDSFIYKALETKLEEVRKKKNNVAIDWVTWWFREGSHVDGDPKSTDVKFLRDLFLSILVAGRDTTSVALTWFFWLVFKNPGVENTIREEIKSVVPQDNPDHDNFVQANDVRKLVYLHGALCETLRLYPSLPLQIKTPLEPDVLPSGHKVYPMTKIIISIHAMGRDESIWGGDCLEFKPERWITKSGRIKHEPSYKFFSFNAGPRTCVGKDMALVQMKAIASAIFLHGYRFQVVEEHKVEPQLSILLHTKHGLKAKVMKVK